MFTFSNIKDGTTIKLKNDFGDINIIYWDKDKIMLDRKQSICASTLSEAEEMINSRVVKHSFSDNVYSFVLERADTHGSIGGYNIEDTWTVYVPKGKLSFDVASTYGNINFPEDVRAYCIKVSLRHGDLRMENVQTVNKCYVNVEFGNVRIGEANDLIVTTKYTDADLGQIDSMGLQAAHSDIGIRRLRTGYGTLSFTELKLGSLERSLNISKCRYGGINVHVTDGKKFEELLVFTEHTPIKIFVPKQFNARYMLQALHGSVKLAPGMHSIVSRKNKFICVEKGYIGNNPNAKPHIQISTEFKDIRMKQQ